MSAPAGNAVRTGAIVRAALVGAARMPLLAIWTVGLLVPAVVGTLPLARALSSVLDHAPRAATPLFDAVVGFDTARALGEAAPAIGGGLVAALVLTLLVSPLLTGVTVVAFRSPGIGTGALLGGAVALWPRLARLLLLGLLPYGAAAVIAGAVTAWASSYGQHATLEARAVLASRAALGVSLLAFALAQVVLDAARATLAADVGLRSAWGALVRGLRLCARRPLPVLGASLATGAAAFVVASLLAIVRVRLVPFGTAAWVGAWVVTQLMVAALGWGRAARLLALAALARGERRES